MQSSADPKAYVKEITVLLNEGALTLVEWNNETDQRIKFEDGHVRGAEVQQFCHDEGFRQVVYKMIKTINEQGGKLTGKTAKRKKQRTAKAEAAAAPAAEAAAPAPAAEAAAAGAAEAEAEAAAVEAAAESPAAVEAAAVEAPAAEENVLPLMHPMALLTQMKW